MFKYVYKYNNYLNTIIIQIFNFFFYDEFDSTKFVKGGILKSVFRRYIRLTEPVLLYAKFN